MRILLYASEGTNSRSILLDVEAGFREAGHEVIRWEFGPIISRLQGLTDPAQRTVWASGVAELVRTLIESNGVELTVGMWANGLLGSGLLTQPDGSLRSFFSEIGVRHLMFWLDAPHWAHSGEIHKLFGRPLLREPELMSVVNNEGIAREMREVLGFGRTLAEPYGVNTRVFSPRAGVACEHDAVMNVGPGDPAPTERMLAELGSDDPDFGAIRAELAPSAAEEMLGLVGRAGLADTAMRGLIDAWVDAQLADPSVPLMDRLERIVEQDPALSDACWRVRANPSLFVKLGAAARRIDGFRRAFTASWLSRRLDLAVFGADPLRGWPHDARLLGEMVYEDMPGAYARGRIGINVMRWQDDIGLNIKPLEICASGVACLCADRVGLGGLFEIGIEIESFGSPAEALERARGLLDDPERRAAMAEAGLARVRRDHTWARWASSVVAFAEGAGVGSGSVPAGSVA